MSDRSGGYVVDVGFTHGYCAELSPNRAKLAMLKTGLVAPEVTTACELGFGQGVSLAVHAAASSTVWYGNDLNLEHVAAAATLIDAAKATAHVYPDSFAEFAERTDLPDFDYIGLSGVWSWISDENRSAIIDFVGKRLKIGGVLYLYYVTLPGWAPYLPMRELLVKHAESAASAALPLLDRVEASLDFAARFLATAPAYLSDNPAVGDYLGRIGGKNRHYLAHEYYNRHYQPMHFSTVASLLMPAGLTYVGPADFVGLESVHLTRPQQDLLASVDDPVLRELSYDLLINRYARSEYWVRGPATRLGDADREARLGEVRFIATTSRPELPFKLRAALSLNAGGQAGAVYKLLLERLSHREAVSIAALEKALPPGTATRDQILEAALLVAGHGQLAFVQPDEPSDALRQRTAGLNTHLMESLLSGDKFDDFMASPVTGGGVPVGRLSQLFLLALRDGATGAEALATFASKFPAKEPVSIERARVFMEAELPLLKALGIA